MKQDNNGLEIAIIGISCRFPGARNKEQFWENLCARREAVSHFSIEELVFSGNSLDHILAPGYVRAKGRVPGAYEFASDFFDIRDRDADVLDPQQRIFLECSWEAFEDAGYVPKALDIPVGIYAGCTQSSYLSFHIAPNRRLVSAYSDPMINISNSATYLPSLVAYKLDLRGPAVSVNTACSTSLVATHLACKSLLAGECDMALAGAASISFPDVAGYFHEEGAGALSPDGHCRSFDKDARGTVCSGGVGVVLLKRLEDALADRDHVYAIIKGSAVNNDGRDRVGFTAPSVSGQSAVIRAAHQVAEVSPHTIRFVEAHGTATRLGDPIEISALSDAFGGAQGEPYCAVGSVKSGIGHASEAAGVAGLIKAALSLHHRRLPATLHVNEPNPDLSLGATPFYLARESEDWRESADTLRGGVSSFGLGGTNAHVVLEMAPRADGGESVRSGAPDLILVSGRTAAELARNTAGLAQHLRSCDQPLGDIAYTLAVGRTPFAHRLAVMASSRHEAAVMLEAAEPASSATSVSAPRMAFLIDALDDDLRRVRGRFERIAGFEREFQSTIGELGAGFIAAIQLAWKSNRGAPWEMVQAAFVAHLAMGRLLTRWGVRPSIVLGLGAGELVALVLSGAIKLEDALEMLKYAKPDDRAHLQAVAGGSERPGWVRPGPEERDVRGVLAGQTVWQAADACVVIGCRDTPAVRVEKPGGRRANFSVSEDVLENALLHDLKEVWLMGCNLDWRDIYKASARQRVPLPTYSFSRKTHRLGPVFRAKAQRDLPKQAALAPEMGRDEANEPSLAELVSGAWCEVLGLDAVDVDASFFDLGGDSVLASRLAIRLKESFPLEVPLSTLFEHRTVRAQVTYIEGSLTEMLANMSEQEIAHLREEVG